MSADQSTNPAQDLADGLATLTDEERAALNEDVDELKRDDSEVGDDDEGEDDDGEAGDDATEADDTTAAKAPEAKPAPKADPVAEDAPPAEADTTDEPEARAPRQPIYDATLPEDFEERKTALNEREEEAERKYEDGEIDRATLRATLREVATEREGLIRLQTKAELAAELVEQDQRRELQSAVGVVMQLGTKAGVDYNDEARWAELKAFAAAVEARNPNRTAEWVLREAHRKVLVANDITPPDTKDEPKPKADPKAEALARRKADPSKAGPSLAQVPGGDGPGDVGSEFADIDALDGAAYEQALERLRKSNPAAYEKYMAET